MRVNCRKIDSIHTSYIIIGKMTSERTSILRKLDNVVKSLLTALKTSCSHLSNSQTTTTQRKLLAMTNKSIDREWISCAPLSKCSKLIETKDGRILIATGNSPCKIQEYNIHKNEWEDLYEINESIGGRLFLDGKREYIYIFPYCSFLYDSGICVYMHMQL